jgi:hypothetical protein
MGTTIYPTEALQLMIGSGWLLVIDISGPKRLINKLMEVDIVSLHLSIRWRYVSKAPENRNISLDLVYL